LTTKLADYATDLTDSYQIDLREERAERRGGGGEGKLNGR